MQLYVDAQNGTDTAGQGTSWATAYATPDFALQDLWDSHGRDTTTDPSMSDTINCMGVFTPSTAYSATLSPLPSLSRRVYFLARGKFAVDDGLRTEINAADGIWAGSTQDRIHWFGFYFTWNNSATTQRAFHFDRDCLIYNCIVDGRNDITIQPPFQVFYYFVCKFSQLINLRNSISATIGTRFENNFITFGEGTHSVATYRGGAINNNVVIVNRTGAATTQAIYINAGGEACGNSCFNVGTIKTGSHGARLLSESFLCVNNYFEGFDIAIRTDPIQYHWYVQNNLCFDCNTPSNGTAQPVTPTITELSESMYVDFENGDYTIKNPQAIARRLTEYGGVEYFGGVQQIQPQKNGYNPFGGN